MTTTSDYFAKQRGPITVTGNVFFGHMALGQRKKLVVAVVGPTVEDVEQAWPEIFPDIALNKEMIQEIVIGEKSRIEP